jgi:hypothetical protein
MLRWPKGTSKEGGMKRRDALAGIAATALALPAAAQWWPWSRGEGGAGDALGAWEVLTRSFRTSRAYQTVHVDGSTSRVVLFAGALRNGVPTTEDPDRLWIGRGDLGGITDWRVAEPPHDPRRGQTYCRAVAASWVGDAIHVLAEARVSYADGPIRRIAARSLDGGKTMQWRGEALLDGAPMPSWDGALGLVHQPEMKGRIDLRDLTRNRFVCAIAPETPIVIVSADGLTWVTGQRVAWPWPDRATPWPCLARSSAGWHLTAKSRWQDYSKYNHTYPDRHAFSTDLRAWRAEEHDIAFSSTTDASGWKETAISWDPTGQWLYGYWAYVGSSVLARRKLRPA